MDLTIPKWVGSWSHVTGHVKSAVISYKLYLSVVCDGFDIVLKKKNSSCIVGKFKYLCLVANQSLGGGQG